MKQKAFALGKNGAFYSNSFIFGLQDLKNDSNLILQLLSSYKVELSRDLCHSRSPDVLGNTAGNYSSATHDGLKLHNSVILINPSRSAIEIPQALPINV